MPGARRDSRSRRTPHPVPRSRTWPRQCGAAKPARRTESIENRYPLSGCRMTRRPSLPGYAVISRHGEDEQPRPDLRIEERGLLREDVPRQGHVTKLRDRHGIEEEGCL